MKQFLPKYKLNFELQQNCGNQDTGWHEDVCIFKYTTWYILLNHLKKSIKKLKWSNLELEKKKVIFLLRQWIVLKKPKHCLLQSKTDQSPVWNSFDWSGNRDFPFGLKAFCNHSAPIPLCVFKISIPRWMKPARRDLARVKTAMLIIKGPLPAAGKYTWFHLIYKRTNLNLKKKKKILFPPGRLHKLQSYYTNY